jgi:hypothetical protein
MFTLWMLLSAAGGRRGLRHGAGREGGEGGAAVQGEQKGLADRGGFQVLAPW